MIANEAPRAPVAHDLSTLAEAYGSTAVTVEEFASLIGARSPSAVRMRRDRDPKFPAPVRGGSRPEYGLAQLCDWLAELPARRQELEHTAAPWALQHWALKVSARRCAAVNDADTTFRLIAAAALLLAEGWLPDTDIDATPLLDQLLHPELAPPGPAASSLLPAEFEPDPPPARDVEVMRRLLGEPFSDIRDVDRATGVVTEVARAWTHRLDLPATAGFVELIEETVARLASRSEKHRPTTDTLATELLVELAGLEPGQVVLDPATGEANLLLRADAVTRGERLGTQVLGLVGRDIDPRVWLVAKVRLGLRGLAHQLGEPGCDSTDPKQLSGEFDRVLAEPGVGLRALRGWLERLPQLLTPDGLAVVAVPPDLLLPTRHAGRRWWDEFQRHVAAIVVAPTFRTREPIGAFVLRRQWDSEILLLQVDRPARHILEPGTTEEEALLRRFAVAGQLVRRHIRGAELGDDRLEGVSYRPMSELSVEALDGLRWADTRAVADMVERAPTARAALAATKKRALRLTRELRYYVDSTAELNGDTRGIPDEDRGVFEEDATEEMRRALKRLEQRLAGNETRGRPRKKPR